MLKYTVLASYQSVVGYVGDLNPWLWHYDTDNEQRTQNYPSDQMVDSRRSEEEMVKSYGSQLTFAAAKNCRCA